MIKDKDIRWLQRYDSFHKACNRILEITESDRKPDDLNELEMEGLIQRFEYTFELGWKVLQDYLEFKGYDFQPGPDTTLKQAFEAGLISKHDVWRRMAKARILLRILIMKGTLALLPDRYMPNTLSS
jgi:nucleotidyltransferase substrate binding protein (TIGR01987 family)